MYVLPYFTNFTILHARQLKVLIELMVAKDNKYLLIVLRCPVPKRMILIVLVAQVSDVSSKYEYVSTNFKWMFPQVSPVSANSKCKSDAYCIFMSFYYNNELKVYHIVFVVVIFPPSRILSKMNYIIVKAVKSQRQEISSQP